MVDNRGYGRAMRLLPLLALAACEPPASDSLLAFAIDDDLEMFTDEEGDGIVTRPTCVAASSRENPRSRRPSPGSPLPRVRRWTR